MVGGHYHDIIVSSPGQGKCTFDLEKSSHIRDFSQSNKRESTSLIVVLHTGTHEPELISNLNQKTQKTTVKPHMLRGAS